MVFELSLGYVLQGVVCLVACPLHGAPKLRYINRWKFMFVNVM